MVIMMTVRSAYSLNNAYHVLKLITLIWLFITILKYRYTC